MARLEGQARETVPAPEVADPATDVATMLATLPTQQRVAAALFYVEQLSVREIAETMKLSEGAVKYHLHAARTALRERLETDTSHDGRPRRRARKRADRRPAAVRV